MVHVRITASVFDRLRLFGADARGVAAIEFGIVGLLLVLGLLNAVDVGYYALPADGSGECRGGWLPGGLENL